MIINHALTPGGNSFSLEIARHSGDENRIYKTVDGTGLILSLYYPPQYDPAKKYPLFVFIHGGGWQGRKVFEDQSVWSGDYLGYLSRYYALRGWLCAGIDYRMMRKGGQAAGYEMMDLFEDCMDALEYIKDHADELGADLMRTAVIGESAGGHLAGMLATQTNFFTAAVLANPVTDFTDPKWNGLMPKSPAHSALRGMKAEEVVKLFSPLHQVKTDVCPTLLLHGAADSVVDPRHSGRYYEKMLECGNEAELHWIENTNHAFLLVEYMQELGKSMDAANIAVNVIDEWLDKHI